MPVKNPPPSILLGETLLRINEAAKLVKVDRTTIIRWCIYGARGGTVVLASFKAGSTRLTSREALGRFLDRLNRPDTQDDLPAAGDPDKVAAQLTGMGI